MWKFSKIHFTLLLVLLVTFSSLLVKPTQARAKADWDEDEDETDWWPSSDEDDGGVEDYGEAQGRSVGSSQDTKVVGASGDDHSQHHIHTAGVLANAPNFFDDSARQQGAQGANFAAYNESCSPTGKKCHANDNLYCSTTDGTGRCICKDGYVYVRDTETCWVVPKSGEDPCAHDVQCHAGKWGALSRCSKQSARCECFDYKTNGKRETALVDGVCYIKKTIGDLCNDNDECNLTIPGEAYCKQGNHSSSVGDPYTGSCQCREDHVWYFPLKQCFPLATKLKDPCAVTEQCRQGSLGKYSKCNLGTATCECYGFGGFSNETEVIYFENLRKCLPRKNYNDTCTDVEECRANLGPDVECGTTDEYPDQAICYCPKGRVCRNSAFSTIMASSTPLGLACTAAVVWMTSFLSGVRMEMTSRG